MGIKSRTKPLILYHLGKWTSAGALELMKDSGAYPVSVPLDRTRARGLPLFPARVRHTDAVGRPQPQIPTHMELKVIVPELCTLTVKPEVVLVTQYAPTLAQIIGFFIIEPPLCPRSLSSESRSRPAVPESP